MKTYSLVYTLSDWKERDIARHADGGKVTRVDAAFMYAGALEGATRLGFVMQYLPDGTGTYTGYELFDGAFNGTAGSVVLYHQGRFDPKAVQAHVLSVDGSATGALAGIRLSYDVIMADHGPYAIDLACEQDV
jgi:uncharacterized membrane protein YfcA